MLPGLSCRLPGNAGWPPGEQDRRLLGELAGSLALVAVYTARNQDAFLRNDMAVDATRQRLREIALACARLSGNSRHATPARPDRPARHPWARAVPAWEISRNHLTQLRAVIDSETPSAGDR
jgi:hypothetical protein